jgi:hypothetical protein
VETTSGPECGLAMTQTPRGERVKDADLIVGALPLMGSKFWIAKAAAPGADRVGSEFVLALFPRRAESEPQVTSVPAAEPRPKSRARSRAAA